MAKARTAARTQNQAPAAVSRDRDHKIEAFAEDLGRMLGQAQNKATSWLEQRAALVKQLEGVRDTATQLLTQLGHTASEAVQKVRRGRRPKKYAKPAANPAGGMKPLHRSQQKAPHIAQKSPLRARAQGRFPQARRAPK
jgi:hypothetical protein